MEVSVLLIYFLICNVLQYSLEKCEALIEYVYILYIYIYKIYTRSTVFKTWFDS